MIVTTGDVRIEGTPAEYVEFMRMLSMNQIDMQFTELNNQILQKYMNGTDPKNSETDGPTRG